MESDSVSVVSSTLPRSTKTWSSVRPSVCVYVCGANQILVLPAPYSSVRTLRTSSVYSCVYNASELRTKTRFRVRDTESTMRPALLPMSVSPALICTPERVSPVSCLRSSFRPRKSKATEVRARALLHFVAILHFLSCATYVLFFFERSTHPGK